MLVVCVCVCVCVCVQSLEVLLRHPEDNRNQIRELAQTLMDGGVLDELIQQKLDAFNTRWDELMARVRFFIYSLFVLVCTFPHISLSFNLVVLTHPFVVMRQINVLQRLSTYLRH